jgi:hypothetical protein
MYILDYKLLVLCDGLCLFVSVSMREIFVCARACVSVCMQCCVCFCVRNVFSFTFFITSDVSREH